MTGRLSYAECSVLFGIHSVQTRHTAVNPGSSSPAIGCVTVKALVGLFNILGPESQVVCTETMAQKLLESLAERGLIRKADPYDGYNLTPRGFLFVGFTQGAAAWNPNPE